MSFVDAFHSLWRRGRSYSISGFDFQQDLLPLTSSLSDPEAVIHAEAGEKNLGLINGALESNTSALCLTFELGEGIALVVGLQVRVIRFPTAVYISHRYVPK